MEQPSAKPNRRWARRRGRRGGQRPPATESHAEQSPPSPRESPRDSLIVPARPEAGRGQPSRPKGQGKRPNIAPRPSSGSPKAASGSPKTPNVRFEDRREPAKSEAPPSARPPSEPSPYVFKLGARVRLCDALRQRGGHGRVGVIVWVGNLVDVRWEDETMSFMLPPGLLEPVVEKPEGAGATQETSA